MSLGRLLSRSNRTRIQSAFFSKADGLIFLCRLLGAGFALLPSVCQAEAAEVDYSRDIKPLLRERCYTCHGALQQKAKLRLDTVQSMLQGGKSGPILSRGDASKSLLLERVSTSHLDERMPPEHEGESFSVAQISLLRTWIQQGALSPADEQPEADPKSHWAFRPRRRPDVPGVRNSAWVRNPIDAFLAREHDHRGIRPLPEAPRAVLVRRLYLDLIGLPPSAAEITAAEAATAPDWYEAMVDRLLSDPRHGERWARHWMDVWRYSDWWGLGDQLRNSQKHIWHWRDWIIESVNADTPYDEMIRLMLAADESHPDDLGRLRATGYLGRNYFLFNRNQWMDETVEHVGKSFLGLTLNCAKCHDHKYDPIAQGDFYKLRAFFEPYQVRVDVLPGEPDLNRDGLPRVYDAYPPPPTYRFVRGQEKEPDLSAPIAPAIPEMLVFGDVRIQPVELPVEAWQPDRRPWVGTAYLDAARQKLTAAESSWHQAREKQRQPPSGSDETALRQAELRLAEATLRLAQSELIGLESRLTALQAEWSKAGTNRVQETRQRAVRAERDTAVVRARQRVLEVELKRLRAAPDQQAAIDKELVSANEAVAKAEKELEAPVGLDEKYTRLVGASWTATRFLDSTKDDPRVEFAPRSTGRRTALAAWITDPRNPLTARVAINHLWMRHFGAPLVPSVFDFGRKNATPLFPELIDWLASELVDSGWSLKHVHRLMVTSSAYRLSSSLAGADAQLSQDPDNLRWWRRTPVRLEAQVIRDSILAQAGRLDVTQGGPPVPPAEQEASRRRSLYFVHSNNDQNLFLSTFDDAAVKECYRRDQSVVPQQALALSNSKLVQEAAPLIAARLSREALGGGGTEPEVEAMFVRSAFLALLGFAPTGPELTASAKALEEWRRLASVASDPAPAERARASLVWALLNHNDFVTMR
jgi:hypothetical protein